MISALDNHLLRAYLDGEMDEAAAEAFEILMIERPELAELVDADTALRMGLSAPRNSAGPTELPAGPASMPAAPIRHRTRVPQWIPLLAAASVMLAVGLALGRLWAPQPADLTPTTLLSVDRMRSSISEVPKLRLPRDGQIVLSVPIAAGSSCKPTVRILYAGNVLQAQVMPDDFGFANLGLPATRLAPGKAEVSVACDGRELARYPVEFVR
ncbi:MAG: hypothetical protein AMXMBFR59_37530 [Rhodanobacteraceae bacterium]